MTRNPTLCDVCIHKQGMTLEGVPACKAFPAGIPDEIRIGGFDHRNPAPDDGGVLFEVDPSAHPNTVAKAIAAVR